MKKSKTLIAIIAMVIVATAVAVVSCKKEKQERKSNNVEQSVQNSDNMDEYLMSFKKKLLSAQKGEV
jgi:mannose/fructose/N-acetylgalactosamine-specific phosphotransferase system component IIC